MDGPWFILANHQWDFAAGPTAQPFADAAVRELQPPHGWYIHRAITGDFSSGSQWTVPVGGGGGKLWRVGKVGLPVNTQLQAYYNADTPRFGPDWQLRFQLQFCFRGEAANTAWPRRDALGRVSILSYIATSHRRLLRCARNRKDEG
jgi:hypothetical protein